MLSRKSVSCGAAITYSRDRAARKMIPALGSVAGIEAINRRLLLLSLLFPQQGI